MQVGYSNLIFTCLTVGALVWAQDQQSFDFAAIVRTPAGIQAALERCDGHPAFETAFANWLETAQPRSAAEREGIRVASLRLLEDTTDRQLVLGLIDGLLRHAIDDVKSDAALVPKDRAKALFADIANAVRKQRYKANESAVVAYGIAEETKDERQLGFVKEFMSLSEPPARRLPATNANVSTVSKR